jgi:PEP-CTERM motif
MIRKMFVTYAISVAVVILMALASLDSQSAVLYRTVAFTGEAAPDAGAGVVYDSFANSPVINGAGQVSFSALLNGLAVDITNDSGIWSEASGELTMVAREGNRAPGTESGVIYNSFARARYVHNDMGQTVFRGVLTGPGVDTTNDDGLWLRNTDSLSLLARGGDAAAGLGPGVVYELVTKAALNNTGQVAFRGRTSGDGSSIDRGLWLGTQGSFKLIARDGDPAVGAGPGVVYNSLSNTDVALINDIGQTAFISHLSGPNVSNLNDVAIWMGGYDSLVMVIRQGDSAPGTGAAFDDPRILSAVPAINDLGQIAFANQLIGAGVNISNDQGIWSGSPGALNLVVRQGDAAPGTDVGVNFGNLKNPVLNDTGEIAFRADVGSGASASTGIWAEDSDTLGLVALASHHAPGTDPGVVFQGFSGGMLFNAAGQIAFGGSLTGTGVDDSNSNGIWATDDAGELSLVVREADTIDVNNDPSIDDIRTISTISSLVDSGEDGRLQAFNDAGQLAIRLSFTDSSSGIFVFTTNPIEGDLDGDGFVGIADLNIVLGNWNQNVPPGDPRADPSGNGFVGITDLNFVLGNWNAGTPPPVEASDTVPEPGTLLLLATGGAGLLRRRAR